MTEKTTVVEFEPRLRKTKPSRSRSKAQLENIAGRELLVLGSVMGHTYYGLKAMGERRRTLQIALLTAGVLIALAGVIRMAVLLIHG